MPTAVGKLKVLGTELTTSLLVKGPPDVEFAHPLPEWVRKLISGNSGCDVEIGYEETPGPPVVRTITSCNVG